MAQKLSGILSPLSADYSSQCEALATALYISKITSDKFKTSLAGFEGVVGDVNTVNHGDFKWLIGIYQGLGEFFAPFGGVEALNKKHVHIDFAKILNEVCGIYVLCYLLEALAPKFDLGKISGKQMNNDLEFASLLTKLGGEVDYGADGFIFLLTEITKYHYGASSKENLRAVLVKYCTNPRGSHDKVEEQWLSALGTLRKTLKKLKLEESFERVTKAVDSILDGKWHQKGINMSAVVKDILQIQLPAKADAADKILEKL
ncbi:hypothetical protein Zmor_007726 [Zophobas morio]|uniref:Uncharacterized protein n=1 Tax=Zophobas morio TaxID=2755281 RepID=A0AA38IU30_9CUCU|nr:hypothetical protein Zmor_007726 [Zophobas morio]